MTPRISVAAVLFVSAATLAYEVLLVRAFSIQYFNHLAFMAIGVAMLGMGGAGVLLALLGNVKIERGRRWFVWATLFTAMALIVSPYLVDRVALDPTQILWNPDQWVQLGVVYVLLALPFGFGAVVVLLGLMQVPERTGRVYGASFLGAALGALLSLAILTVAMPDRALAVPAMVASVGAVAAVVALPSGSRRSAGVVAPLVTLLAAIAFIRPPWTIEVSPHKAMPQVEAFPNAELLGVGPSPAGWVAAVRAPGFRYAPGLSIAYRGIVPSQVALFVDGGLVSAVDQSLEPEFYEWLPSWAPFVIDRRRQVLVLGGGTEVSSAVRHGAERVIAVQPHRRVLEFERTLGWQLSDTLATRIEWVASDIRSFVAGTERRFDLVALRASGGPGGNAGGLHALNEDYLYTVDAFEAYLRLLRPGGVLLATEWVSLPPKEAVRLILTAGRALRSLGADPATGLLVLRSWATVTVLMKREPFVASEVDALLGWAESRQFDVDWYAGIDDPNPRFNLLDDPAPYLAAQAIAAGNAAADHFSNRHVFDVAPVSDARPYPNHFLRLGGIGQLFRLGTGAALPFAELGLLAVLATLVQSAVLGALLMLLPVAIGMVQRRRSVPLRPIVYFSAIGLAYMTAEIAAIQTLTLLLGQLQYAVTAVLALFLIGSGVGSILSDRVDSGRAVPVAFAVAVTFGLYALLLLPLVHSVHSAPFVFRALVAAILVLPPALLMGVPFPLGLRGLAGDDRTMRALAWAGNGFAAVVATPLAALIALELGSPALFLVGAAAYAVAGAAWRAAV